MTSKHSSIGGVVRRTIEVDDNGWNTTGNAEPWESKLFDLCNSLPPEDELEDCGELDQKAIRTKTLIQGALQPSADEDAIGKAAGFQSVLGVGATVGKIKKRGFWPF